MADNTVTRAQLSEAVYQEVGLSRYESAQLVEAVLDESHRDPVLALPPARRRGRFWWVGGLRVCTASPRPLDQPGARRRTPSGSTPG